MTLRSELAQHALLHHPTLATQVLERLDESETVRLLGRASRANAAAILERLSPHYAATVLREATPQRAAEMLDALSVETATRIVRRVDESRQEAVLSLVDPKRARSIRLVLRFPEGSAGAMMDPDVLTLPAEISAREALQRVRKNPALARYNVYVVDQSQQLIGAINLRELLLASGRVAVSDLMVRDPHRVSASANRSLVVAHPGWKQVHALPVVDEKGAFIGAIRYHVLRRLEEEEEQARGARNHDSDAGAALGQVFAAGARGLIDALSGAAETESGRSGNGANNANNTNNAK